MSRRHTTHRRSRKHPSVTELKDDRIQLWLLAGVVMLHVATVFVPSENAASLGTTILLDMAWMILGVLGCGFFLLRRKRIRRPGPADIAVLAMVICVVVSGWITKGSGNQRATVNATWQWMSLGMGFWLVRQAAGNATVMRGMVAVMLALAACQSTVAFYQYGVELPRLREEYARHPEAFLAEAGIDSAEGSLERTMFENRLNSTEPTVTFALTNSLAGFLLPWWLIGCFIAWQGVLCFRQSRRELRTLIGPVLLVVVIAGALVLTKSRSAMLAGVVGLGLLAYLSRRQPRRLALRWKLPLVGIVSVTILAGFGALFGGWDREVFSEAPKSVLYRIEYWQSTIPMIAERPWWGCGASNFQNYYTAFKLPQASETVADPHNFLLEIAATAGLPAMFCLVVAILFCLRKGWMGRQSDLRSEEVDKAGKKDSNAKGHPPVAWLYAGGVAGMLLGLFLRMLFGFGRLDTLFGIGSLLVIGLPTAIAVVLSLRGWVEKGLLSSSLLTVALAALLLHLLATGGISFPAVAGSLWLIAALALNLCESSGKENDKDVRPAVGWVATLAMAAVAIACYITAYKPVLGSMSAMNQGDASLVDGNFKEAATQYDEAARLDSISSLPLMRKASLEHLRWMDEWNERGTMTRLTAAIEYQMDANRLARRSEAGERHLATWQMEAYRATGDSVHLDAAIDSLRRAVEIYPNHNIGHAELAWALHLAGHSEEAATEATQALRLDALLPHKEKKLDRLPLFPQQKTPAPPPSLLLFPADSSAEALMRQLLAPPM